MSTVSEHDGVAPGVGHDLTWLIRYDGGRHDRNEREFFGFATVQTVRPDGGLLLQRYHNDAFRHHGLLASEELHDASGRLFDAMVNVYDDSPALVAPALDECRTLAPFFLDPDDYCSAAWTRLLRTEKRFFEGSTNTLGPGLITTARDYTYDLATGNVLAYDDFGDVNDPAEALSATVQYLSGTVADTLHAIDRPLRIVVQAGPVGAGGPVLRDRSALYDGLANLVETNVNLGTGARR
jgi:hypothetical protein